MKQIRLNLGLTQRDISRIIYPDSDNNLLGIIESNFRQERYNEEHLFKLAKAFSRVDPIREYSLNDFYPSEPLEETMVEKIVDGSPEQVSPTNTFTNLLDNDKNFLGEFHSLKEITDHCNLICNRDWKTTDFTSVIARAEASGKLVRLEENPLKFKKA